MGCTSSFPWHSFPQPTLPHCTCPRVWCVPLSHGPRLHRLLSSAPHRSRWEQAEFLPLTLENIWQSDAMCHTDSSSQAVFVHQLGWDMLRPMFLVERGVFSAAISPGLYDSLSLTSDGVLLGLKIRYNRPSTLTLVLQECLVHLNVLTFLWGRRQRKKRRASSFINITYEFPMISFELHKQPHEIMSTFQIGKLRRGSVAWHSCLVRAQSQNPGQSDSSHRPLCLCTMLPPKTKQSVTNPVFLESWLLLWT